MYEEISLSFGGWSLSEIKDMVSRERKYWLEVIRWRREMQQNG